MSVIRVINDFLFTEEQRENAHWTEYVTYYGFYAIIISITVFTLLSVAG